MLKQVQSDLIKAILFADRILVKSRWDKNDKAFIEHNKKVWGCFLSKDQGGEILLESSTMASSIIAFSYLANLLASLHNARIKAYLPGRKTIKTRLENRNANRIYKSFNVSDFIYYELSLSQQQVVEKLFETMIPRLKTKRDVEALHFEDVWIGDLLYDSHCMDYKVPTIDLQDLRFQDSLRKSLCTYVFWRDYLNVHNVHAVIVSHTVYIKSGVITRLAIQRGIPVYQINATHLYFLNEKNLLAYNEFFYYPEKFRELSKEEQENGLESARLRLDQRFSGAVGVDMHYSTKSAYSNISDGKILKDSNRIKILIATHCFFDSPHPYGVNLFPDFYEWLTFLGGVSEITDYDWYIKTHPDFLPGNLPIIEDFIRKYPKFNLIPAETSHLQLIKEGINIALTVYGTIGFEYAALGMPVINASMCNPRIRYNFNIHPKSVEDLMKNLLNLSDIKLNINLNEVYEFYFMKFLNNTDNWLFNNLDAFLKEAGGYYRQFESISYKKYIDEFNDKKHTNILSALKNFIASKDYHFQKKHINNVK